MLELPQYKFVAKTALLWARSFIIFANLLVTFQKPQQWICILLEIFANEPLLHLHIINYNRALGWLHCTWILLDCSASMCGQLSSLLYLCATIQVLRKYEQALSQTKVLLRQTVSCSVNQKLQDPCPKGVRYWMWSGFTAVCSLQPNRYWMWSQQIHASLMSGVFLVDHSKNLYGSAFSAEISSK